jgi:hypothetical protein
MVRASAVLVNPAEGYDAQNPASVGTLANMADLVAAHVGIARVPTGVLSPSEVAWNGPGSKADQAN